MILKRFQLSAGFVSVALLVGCGTWFVADTGIILTEPGAFFLMTISPDTKHALMTNRRDSYLFTIGNVSIADGATDRRVRNLPVCNKAVFSHDSQLLAAALNDNTILIYHLDGLSPPRVLRGPVSTIVSMSFSQDNDLLASGHLNGTVMIWNVDSGAPQSWLQRRQMSIERVAFAPRENFLAIAGNGPEQIQIAVMEPPYAQDKYRLRLDERASVESLTFSPKGKVLAVGLSTDASYIVDFQSADGEQRALRHLSKHLMFSADGSRLAGIGPSGAKVWETQEWNVLSSLSEHNGSCIVFDQSNVLIGRIDGEILDWDPEKGRVHEVGVKPHHKLPILSGLVVIAIMTIASAIGLGTDGIKVRWFAMWAICVIVVVNGIATTWSLIPVLPMRDPVGVLIWSSFLSSSIFCGLFIDGVIQAWKAAKQSRGEALIRMCCQFVLVLLLAELLALFFWLLAEQIRSA